jgi:hypothetical protein
MVREAPTLMTVPFAEARANVFEDAVSRPNGGM